jgi:hypothetical protein
MIEKYKKMIALCVTLTFLTLLPVYSLPRPAGQSADRDKETTANADQAQNYVEKEQQAGYQVSSKNSLPIIIGMAVLAAGIFVLVILISQNKYVITGDWDFHHDYTTAGYTDYDSVWTFTPSVDYRNVMGTYSMNVNGTVTTGQYTIMNKKEVVFQDDNVTSQYVGQFDSKTTMSGTFVISNGAKGNWTATKR